MDTAYFKSVPGIIKLTILGSSLSALICVYSVTNFPKKISETDVNKFHSGCQLKDQKESIEVFFDCVEDAKFINTYIKAETIEDFNTEIQNLEHDGDYYLFNVSFSTTQAGVFSQVVFITGIIFSILTALIACLKINKTVRFLRFFELIFSVILSLLFLAASISLGMQGGGHDGLYAGCVFGTISLVASLVDGGGMLLVLMGVLHDNNWSNNYISICTCC